MYFIGVDHHKQVSVMTVLDEDGQELRTERIVNRRSHVQLFLEAYRPFRAVVEAVYPAIRRDLVLLALYKRLARRKGANVAKIAVARRLLTIIYRVLSERRDYIPGLMKQSAA